jgi:lactose/raffinose/galactose permease
LDIILYLVIGLVVFFTLYFAIWGKRNGKNVFFFGMGTIGRDMFYAMESMFLVYFLTEVLDLSDAMFLLVGGILTGLRIFDALNDPFMGLIVDNTKSRRGKYKPWILIGAVASAFFMVMLFTNFGQGNTLSGENINIVYVVFFVICYLAWDITYGLNDIAYWSMLPALSLDQKQREKIGSFARICANIGLFAVVVGILPLTNMLGEQFGSLKQGWFIFAVGVAAVMIGFQLYTIFGAKEYRGEFKKEEKTTLKGMFRALVKNDQLLFTVISMGLFTIGYVTTTSFGTYFFKYAFRDEEMYSQFALILGVSQIFALIIFPFISKHISRKRFYFVATVLVLAGYALFFFSPMNMIPIGIAGVLLFVGEAFIQLLMLMFLSDTIEYGQWKFGKRNQGVTLSVQPLINKIGGAIATGIMTITLFISGINSAKTPDDVTETGLLTLKLAMFVVPLICIIAGYIVYRLKFKIDKQFYDKIVSDLAQRGDIKGEIVK